VRVIEGRVLDIAVDIRQGSPTFGKHVSMELTEENKTQLLVPHGFAHGFLVLSDTAKFAYKVDNYYSPEHERGIAYNDKILQIDWQLPLDKLKLSSRDGEQKPFEVADYFEKNTTAL
jgi:dTDP-4-dehydrorhamnose 3,5-epimerase